ncbi:MAG: hypothetical protein ABFD29_03260 [Anaerolineaceae bacterium]
MTIAIEKLKLLLSDNEITDLIEAFDTVFNYRNGYGNIHIYIGNKRINKIEISSTIKPGKK